MEGLGRLSEHTVLLTGAGRGLGHGVAQGLASHGATILAVARTRLELDALAGIVRERGGQIETFEADLAQHETIESLAGRILSTHGGVDVLINNAAILRSKTFIDLSDQEFEETLAVNLLAAVRLIRSFLPAMLDRQWGSIINVSSAAGVKGFTEETDYCTSKFGLEGFLYALARELQSLNISVNLVTPGYRIKLTSVTAAEFESWPAEQRAEYRDPIDMADGFAFLALQDGRGITGQRFNAYELAERVRTDGWDWRPS